jgi:SNF2 family DNA or RNA helicase
MGLGKTIQIISLILSNSKDDGKFIGPTLIIAPVSVLSNWETQFDDHTAMDSVSVYVHHGRGRSTDASDIEQYDIVLTSYQTVSLEFAEYQEDSPLHKVEWHRIVLDEAHCIRTWRTKQTKAVLCLNGLNRWCLTGTPIQNRIDDLFPLLAFLRVPGLCDINFWNTELSGPLKRGMSEAMNRLKLLLRILCLRRLKSMKVDGKEIVNLPEKKIMQVSITLSAKERAIYDTLSANYRTIIGDMIRDGTFVNSFFMHTHFT